jgi:hypothetical protein
MAVASNIRNCVETVKVLLVIDHSFEVNLALLIAVAQLDADAGLLVLLLARFPNVPTTEVELVAAAKCCRYPELIAACLLDRDTTFEVTEAVVIAEIGHEYDRVKLMEVLLARSVDFRISERVAAAAVESVESCGGKLIELLLTRNGAIQIPRMTMMGAVSGQLSKGLLQLLLTAHSDTQLTDSLLIEAASTTWGSEELVRMLLAGDGTVEITEGFLVVAAANGTGGGEGPGAAVVLLELLLARDPSIQITEVVIVAAAAGH